MRLTNKGFTLMELIIVIIIIGVLASLALPRFLNTVEATRGGEALQNIAAIRGAMNRCYLRDGNFNNCNTYPNLDLVDPQLSPGNHFTYAMTTGATTYLITGTRNALDNGVTTDTVFLSDNGTVITKGGTTAFSDIR